MPLRRKQDYPTLETRRHLETGPIVLVSSHWRGKSNIQTLGWHGMAGYDQVITYIWDANHSFNMIRKSRQCVINVPTEELADTVVAIGNTSGRDIDKFRKFKLTAEPADRVAAPLIGECYASFECELDDDSLIDGRSLFIWNVVKAHVSPTPKNPRTLHYRGAGKFMVGGREIDLSEQFLPERLGEEV